MNDLSSTPAIPATLDAAPEIRRSDYQPPAWLVPEIALDFALSLTATNVRNTMVVERQGEGPLRLNGDGLAAASVLVDGTAHNDWRMDGDMLVIDLPGARHTVTLETTIDPTANTQLSGPLCLKTACSAPSARRKASAASLSSLTGLTC